MSRTVIAAVVAAVIVGLTAIAFVVTNSSFSDRADKVARDSIQRAHDMGGQLNQLRGLDVQYKAERLASVGDLLTALHSQGDDRDRNAQIGFQAFVVKESQKPDVIALLDKDGNVIAMYQQAGVVATQWKDAKGASIIPAVNEVLKRRVIISDVWDYGEHGLMKVGVAPVIDASVAVDPAAAPSVDAGIVGAVVVGFTENANLAQTDKSLLGADVAYHDGKRVVATSFTLAGGASDMGLATELNGKLANLMSKDQSTRQQITLGGTDYYVAFTKVTQSASKALPADYPKTTAGTIVLSPIEPPSSVVGATKLFILLLGAGSLVIALLGLYLSNRRIIAQVDQVEAGVTDIINGNVDRTFRPVGPELDGLANGLNVMLARLMGRPEPGEEEFDEQGNVVTHGQVDFDDGGDRGAAGGDPDLAALAQESEPDYYKRVWTEYLNAKRAAGTPDEVSFENFIAKLKVNEGKLKAQYQCRAVRFRVVTKDGKVSLKPVPIFA